jgi:DNA polymerase-3 subunit alpha
MAFVHLRAHTEYSVVDGTLRIDDAVAAAAADGQGALAITDLSNLFGAVKFYGAARAAGVKPILGAEVCMAAEAGEKACTRLVLQAGPDISNPAICFRAAGSERGGRDDRVVVAR